MFGGMSMFGCNSIALEHVRSMFGNMFGHVRMKACSDGQNQAYVRRSSKILILITILTFTVLLMLMFVQMLTLIQILRLLLIPMLMQIRLLLRLLLLLLLLL